MTVGPGPNATKGIQYFIGTTATNALTDTYVLAGSLESIGEYGPSSDDIVFEDLTLGVKKHFKGADDDGIVAIGLGMDLSDDGQLAIVAARATKFDFNHKIVYNDAQPAASIVATMTIATPGVITWTAHGLKVGTGISFSTTGALPTGLVAGTTYYIKAVLDANTFTLAATVGGTVIATTGTQSGVHTASTVPTSTTDIFKAKVNSFKRNPGNLQSVVKATVNLGTVGGSGVLTARLP